ncbi:hypothetical protein TWF192_002209 [Orbilia oligospora]|uniref:Uncharacterized protein n=1 Tax=Orbilia oligospora TaxID=2813651 RepID=A0A6G1MGT5_ORBOL|nr:hypothetical protein TWF191_003810 [Orbilia oligospora]KAF3255769.1 hypothetical protein TWF192_002209 [Orbilia oligospora]
MTTSTLRTTQDLKIPTITQEQVAQIVQSNGPEKKRIVALLSFELLKTGVDPLHMHDKAVSMLETTNWSSNSGRILAANLARCYNEGVQRVPDIKNSPYTQSLHRTAIESSTPPGSPPISRLVFSALSSRSSDAMSISCSSLNDDHLNPLDKPLPELPGSYGDFDVNLLHPDYRLTTNTGAPLRHSPTIPEEVEEEDNSPSISELEDSSPSTPKQEDYIDHRNINNEGEQLDNDFDLDYADDGIERGTTTHVQRTNLWELKEVLEELQCDKDYIATLLTSAHVQGKKADLTYVRLKLD